MTIHRNSRFSLIVLASVFAAVLVAGGLLWQAHSITDAAMHSQLFSMATGNKELVVNRLNLEIAKLEHTSRQVSRVLADTSIGSGLNWSAVRPLLAGLSGAFITTADGYLVLGTSANTNVLDQNYFRRAMQGLSTIERTKPRMNEEEQYIMSVPVHMHGAVIATLQLPYTLQALHDICAVLEGPGRVLIINDKGEPRLQAGYSRGRQSTPHMPPSGGESRAQNNPFQGEETTNFFRKLNNEGNAGAVAQLQAGIAANTPGQMDTHEGGTRIFSCYGPVHNVAGWYVVSSVNASAITASTMLARRIIYGVIAGLALFFLLLTLFLLRRKARRLAHLEDIAFTDHITGGRTFSKFALDFPRILEDQPNSPWYLVSFDIHNFKYINMVYGFATGDAILRTVYMRCQSLLRGSEALARTYNDHFVALLQDVSPERMEVFLQPTEIMDANINLRGGVYPIARQEEELPLMLDKANLALYQAKDGQSAAVEFYSREMDAAVHKNEHLQRDFLHALQRDLFLNYLQPKVNIHTRAVVGAEALARMQTEDGALLMPQAFLPLCEKTGLIIELDMTVLDNLLRYLRHAMDHGQRIVPLSLNVSLQHLGTPRFIERILDKLRQYQIPARLLELEFSETALRAKPQKLAQVAREIRSKGIRLALDNFGYAFGSLNVLCDVPLDTLKLAHAFHASAREDKRRELVLRKTLELARELDVDVIFQTVETAEELAYVKSIGGVLVQGEYFAPALPSDRFSTQLQDGTLCREAPNVEAHGVELVTPPAGS